MCRIPGTWHDVEESGRWLLKNCASNCWKIVPATADQSCHRLLPIILNCWARFFNSHWHNSSTVTGTILQQSLARFFNSGWHGSSRVTGKIFSFFYAGSIVQQWRSLLRNPAMYQEYDTWSCFNYQEGILLQKGKFLCSDKYEQRPS